MAEANVTTALSSLLHTAEALNRASDLMNSTLKAVEAELIRANLGIETWIKISSSITDITESSTGELCSHYERYLGFTKMKGQWHLAVRDVCTEVKYVEGGQACPIDESIYEEPCPLAQASRQDRLMALHLLPRVLRALEKEAKETITEIQETTKYVIEQTRCK